MRHFQMLVVFGMAVGVARAQVCPSPYTEPDENGLSALNPAYFDTDGSGVIGFADLANFLSVYGQEVTPVFPCGDLVSHEGYEYSTVLIGNQCWFAENLRTENYGNGDVIPSDLSGSEWPSTTSGAVAVYGEGNSTCYDQSPDGEACDEVWSLDSHGRLYNWHAVNDVRGLCPSGWHIPTDGEWTVMSEHLGGEMIAGVQMKAEFGWANGGNGTNTSGFSGLSGGSRNWGNGYFTGAGHVSYWWSSTGNGSSDAWSRALDYNKERVSRVNSAQSNGLYIRCILNAD